MDERPSPGATPAARRVASPALPATTLGRRPAARIL
jgi:hypothetical protein